MSSIITSVYISKDATKFEDANVVRAIKLKDVDSFIVDISAINDRDEGILYKEGFIRKCTFCRYDREYAEYVRREKVN